MADAHESGFPAPFDEPVPSPGDVMLWRWFSDRRSVLVTTGDFKDFIEAWRAHARLWESPIDALSAALIRQGLAAATLHLANRPRDEIVAWTLNLKDPPTNLFLTGEARRGIVTGRVYVEGVRTAESSRLYIQTLRARGEPTVSAIEVEGHDVLRVFEQYYARSEQSPARFVELGRAEQDGATDLFAMVLGMPGADRAWVEALEVNEIPSLIASSRLLEVRPMRFECGCNPRRMLGALRGIFGEKPEELFQGERSVETTCPRCGRRWNVSREQFEEVGSGG